jgi:hypothetical protein
MFLRDSFERSRRHVNVNGPDLRRFARVAVVIALGVLMNDAASAGISQT